MTDIEKIILSRFKSTSDGTFGKLFVGDRIFYTVEQPWNNNEPFKSCVPSGEYSLVPHSSEKYGQVLCLVNEDLGVTHYPKQNTKRYACLFHVANYAKDVQGCVGVGDSHTLNMVTNSRQSTADFYSLVNPNEIHPITIKWEEV